MIHRPRAAARAAGLGAAAVLLLGCSAGADAVAPAPTPQRVPTLLESANLRLPVQDFLLADSQLRVVSQARLVLVRRCMERFHIDYPTPPPSSTEYGPRSLTDRRYGITDAGLAARAGYGLGSRDPARQKRADVPELSPDGQTVLTGAGRSRIRGLPVPEKGCLGEADRTLDASAPPSADPQLGQTLQFRSFDAARRSGAVQSVLRAWSACMAESGYDYADPIEAAGDPRFSTHTDALEVGVATTDVRCKARTNLVGVWFTVEAALQSRQIAADAPAFEATRTALAARVRTAAALVPPRR